MKIDAIALIETLKTHTDANHGLRVYDLAALLTGSRGEETLHRKIRSTIKALRMQGVPICGHPSRGYYWAESAADVQATINFLRDRAMSSLAQISKLKRVAIPILEGQLELEIGAVPLDIPAQPDYSQSQREIFVVELPVQLLGEVSRYCDEQGQTRQELIFQSLSLFLNGYEELEQKLERRRKSDD